MDKRTWMALLKLTEYISTFCQYYQRWKISQKIGLKKEQES